MRADEQEPDERPMVGDEQANDCEAHIHQGNAGKSANRLVKSIRLPRIRQYQKNRRKHISRTMKKEITIAL